MATVNGTAGDDFVHLATDGLVPPAGYNDLPQATNSSDTIASGGGGDDIVFAGKGGDTISFTGDFTKRDEVDGGKGTDTLALDGDYSDGVVFNADTLLNVEKLVVAAGHGYSLTSHDSTVGAGAKLTLDGKALGAGESLVFNGAAELDGKFNLVGGLGDDSLTGGAGNDTIKGGNGSDTLNAGAGEDIVRGDGGADRLVAASGGTYVLDGGAGDDTIIAAYGGYEVIEAGTGDDVVSLHSTLLVGGLELSGGEGIDLLDIGSLNFEVNEFSAEGSGFELLLSNGFPIQGTESANTWDFSGLELVEGSLGVWLDGQGEDDELTATAIADTLTGGEGADTLRGLDGSDTFAFWTVTESTGIGFDTIEDLSFTEDHIDLVFTVDGINAARNNGTLSAASFDADLASTLTAARLGENDAVLFTPDSGDYAGQTFLVIDAGGGAGYQAGQDMVIALADTSTTGSLDVSDFI